jgi:hypothetical protein
VSDSEKKRTSQQNKALHKWCADVAKVLNDAGADMEGTLQALGKLDVQWTGTSVKEALFKPLLAQVAAIESTADAGTADYTPVVQALSKGCAQIMGITLPAWPSWHRQDQ